MPAQTDTLARIYARSLFDLCNDAGGRDKILEVADELEQICELVRADAGFRSYLDSPVIDTARRSLGVKSIFANRVTDLVLRFLLVLNTNGRLGRIESIHAAFDDLVQEAWGRVEVDVWTAAPLDSNSKDLLCSRLHEILEKEPVLHAWTDASVIGGIRIRIGDTLIDGSVAARLKQFERSLHSSGNQIISGEPQRFMSVPQSEERFE
ncbi:MAG: ATP synthase F1 subunit delta [Phycisphaerales bacterium]|jgi:F-type H+-transporting ATPase subunit delta|nr:ATP synthase F1 subunit delta [Phycisphaerales bacterium]